MRYYCNKCKETITKREYDFSMKKYNRALCRKHQTSTEAAILDSSDIGDVVSKIVHAFSAVYEKGGIGLVLTILGIVMFILFFVFKSVMDLGFLMVVSSASFIFGVYILYQKEMKK